MIARCTIAAITRCTGSQGSPHTSANTIAPTTAAASASLSYGRKNKRLAISLSPGGVLQSQQ